MIGTAGWSIPKAIANSFAGAGSQLERYARVMPAVEINSSFYRPHRRPTYERWAASTPDSFRFAVKLPKEITHTRKLIDAGAPLRKFIAQISGLDSKLGVLLVQLPPSLVFDYDSVAAFFAMLRNRLDPAIAIAAEPRHPSWFAEQADSCLVDHRIGRVAADPVMAPGGEQPGGWTGFVYRRWHGSPRLYYSAYDAGRLGALAQAIAQDRQAGNASWCMFDNTASGAALNDALRLQDMLQGQCEAGSPQVTPAAASGIAAPG